MNRSLSLIALILTLAWFSPNQAQASSVPQTTTGALIAAEASAAALTAARTVSSKKFKSRKRYTKRATAPRKRKLVHSKRRWKPGTTNVAHGIAPRKCKSRKRARRACRTYNPLDEAYIPPTTTQHDSALLPQLARPTEPSVPIVDKAIDLSPTPNTTSDIVEREEDVPLIIQIALTLAGHRVEHALTIVETRDRETGQRSYRIVPGDEAKRTPDEAELPDIILANNERIVADIHSHPQIKSRGRALADKLFADRATHTNRYPGAADYAAVEKREAVSAILNPDGTVFLLRRIANAPSVRVVEGPPLPPVDEIEAHRLDLVYLYAQGYLMNGTWTRPPIAQTAHATP